MKIKTFISSLLLLIIVIAGALALQSSFIASLTTKAYADAVGDLHGWAWTSTTGWISFNAADVASPKDYKVNVAASGDISGYAWSSNIGWISFNGSDVAGCPSSPCQPHVDSSSGAVTGWARALVAVGRTDGWDGWIHLSGTNHGTNANGSAGVTYDSANSRLIGYSWGSDVVGWVNFNPFLTPTTNPVCTGVCGGVVSSPLVVGITATATNNIAPGSVDVAWSSNGPTHTCVASQALGSGSVANSGSQTFTGLAAGTYTYTITCTETGNTSNVKSASAAVVINGNTPADISVNCSVNTGPHFVGDEVSWSATNVSGGNGTFVYSWAFSPMPSQSTGLSTSIAKVKYSTTGQKSATITVTSAGKTAVKQCGSLVNVTVNPDIIEI